MGDTFTSWRLPEVVALWFRRNEYGGCVLNFCYGDTIIKQKNEDKYNKQKI